MTAPNDADRLAHAFLQDGPAELSQPLLARIRGEVHETKQRAVRRPWRTPSMPRTLLIIAPLAAILVAVAAMLLAGSGSSLPVASPSPTASAIASSTPTPVPSPATTPGPSPYPLDAGEAWIVLGENDRATLIRPDGSGSHDILVGIGVAIADPAWSPDGQQLVFTGNDDRGSQLWVADADGTNAHQLTPTPSGCPYAACVEAVNPAWSPDGRTVAYIAPQHDQAVFTKTALMLIDVATGATTEVYGTAEEDLGRPSWSPDSQSIVLEIDRYAGPPEASPIKDTSVAVIDLRSTDKTPTEITDPGLLAGYPYWHPTEDLIVFRTNRLDNSSKLLLDQNAPSNLYTIRPDGSGMTKLTKNEVGGSVVRGPSWTPDGRILFTAYRPTTQDELLRIIDADGKHEGSATGSTITLGQGRWRPGT